ncbi:MAG: hypothetical protein NZ902_00800 [Acidilobaceae archaeon]|nr:hypothetical protein [Acidilobaceae archaeon]MCX8165369.1 hypothetical protein [Acidilobaceae archaeon]MDW7973795.1 hypothetical protein [Sulfolobales archaeon]
MKAWALVLALLLAAVPASGQEELYGSWKSSLEALRDIVGEGIWGEIAGARDLREAVLAQERALSKLRPKLESLPQPMSLPEGRGFEEELERELSAAIERLVSLGILEAQPSVQALQVNAAVKWMRMVADIREAWSARLASLLVAQKLEEGGDPEKALQRIEEAERRIAEAFELSEQARRSRHCIVEFREASSKAIEDLKSCLIQPQPIPIDDPKIGEKVFLHLALRAAGGVKMEPSTVELKITGGSEGRLSFKDVAKVTVEDTEIIFKVSHQIKGEIIGGMTVYLRGDNGETYKVSMPCSIATGKCIRIMMLIPGYDVPMPIKAGTYSVDLEIGWQAEDRAAGSIEISLLAGAYRK